MVSIQTKYFGPSNVRGSRVKATASNGQSITLSWDDALGVEANHDTAAIALCHKMNWTGPLQRGETELGCVYVFETPYSRLEVPSFDFFVAGKDKRFASIAATDEKTARKVFAKNYPHHAGEITKVIKA